MYTLHIGSKHISSWSLRPWLLLKVLRIPFADRAKRSRDLLHAWGRIASGDTLDVIVCHFPSRRNGRKAS